MWTDECQKNFQVIRDLLQKPPILTMPISNGLFKLYSDTSRTATGSSLFQVQDGREYLVAYHSKTLPRSVVNFTVSELELVGLHINIEAFRYLLKPNHFECIVDHSSLVQIDKSKSQAPTSRMNRVLEKLSEFYFSLAYMKGTSLVICDFLSRYGPTTDDVATCPYQPTSNNRMNMMISCQQL